MPTTHIAFNDTGYFSKLICDYLKRTDTTKGLYHNYPDLRGFENQIKLKGEQFSSSSRDLISKALLLQNSALIMSESSSGNITALKDPNTFTLVTGHQLNLFSGPLYFIFKIVSIINLAKQLKKQFPNKTFVPVYWMATEDHDFDEINHFYIGDKKISWDVESAGPVGRKSTDLMGEVYEDFLKVLGNSKNAQKLKTLFKNTYLNHVNLADATRYLVNELFGEYGVVIADGDDPILKQQFSPFAEKELLHQYSIKSIMETNSFLEEHYKIQVNPREINLFYIEDNLRERIILENGVYTINNTSIRFSREEILNELKNNPQKFSPNVILRPLYQEAILPNLSYVGGGGELAYWFQLKQVFAVSEIVFPILLLRNSALITSKKKTDKLAKLNLSYNDLFEKQHSLISIAVKKQSQLDFDFEDQKVALKTIFNELRPLVAKTNKTFVGALEAQEKKQTKGLLNLEKRLLKAEKRKHAEVLERVKEIQDTLFPRQGLQERNVNFSEFYETYGDVFIPTLINELNPLECSYSIVEI